MSGSYRSSTGSRGSSSRVGRHSDIRAPSDGHPPSGPLALTETFSETQRNSSSGGAFLSGPERRLSSAPRGDSSHLEFLRRCSAESERRRFVQAGSRWPVAVGLMARSPKHARRKENMVEEDGTRVSGARPHS